MAAFPKYTYFHATAATGTVVKPGPGVLGAVCVNKALTGTVTLSDGATTIAVLTNGTTAPLGQTLTGPTSFASLRVSMTTAAEDITILYE